MNSATLGPCGNEFITATHKTREPSHKAYSTGSPPATTLKVPTMFFHAPRG